MKKPVKIVELNDLHFGGPATFKMVEELNLFLDYIKDNEVDIVVFGGDYFDRKMSISDPLALAGFDFFKKVLNIVKEKNIKLRVIEGTQSHDMFQPRIFDTYILDENGNPMIDYKYFETIAVEEVLGLRILYIPEEYPINHEEYYKPYQEGQYDFIVSHGTWDFINFGGMVDNDRNDLHTAPVLRAKDWMHALEHGICVSGHIHGRHIYKKKNVDKIIYPSAFTAWSFDQISPRGFISLEINPETHKISYQLIENTASPKFATLNVKDLGLDLETASVEEIKAAIDEQKTKVDRLKVDINDLPDYKAQVFKQLYKGNPEIKVEQKSKKMLLKDSENKKTYEKYNYILEDKLKLEEVIQKFAKEDLGKDIDIKDIKKSLEE